MKRAATFSLFYLVCFLGLFIFFSCGDAEDTQDLITEQTEDRHNPIEVPDDWYKTKDPILRNNYFRAILIEQFGDIPEVRTIARYQRKKELGRSVTIDEYTAYLEAVTHLWPSERNQQTLKSHQESREMYETEDPEVFAKLFRKQLIKQFGDIPEIDILVEVEKKWMAGEVVMLDEYLRYAHAMFHLFPSEETLRNLQQALAQQDQDDV
ncbi:MAG: hypothetical protein OXU51_13490 [Candidatus Poribacteria bacterium]|nr:hypothetical protein [Candidatus Poribacteria bacterium]